MVEKMLVEKLKLISKFSLLVLLLAVRTQSFVEEIFYVLDCKNLFSFCRDTE